MIKYLLIFLLLINARLLSAQTASVKLLDASGIEISSHASISDAYTAIAVPLTQAHTIELQSTYLGTSETVPLVFLPKAGASATNTITIRPAANFSSVTLSASVSGSLVELNDADYLILDGRPGGVGTTRAITLNNTGTNGNTLGLVNGASYNIIRYLHLQNSGTGSASRTIAVLTSVSNTDGNSNNRFEYNLSTGSRYGINTNGTAANPNRNNVYYGNEIQSTIFSGFWAQSGTGNVILDSNIVYGTNTPSTSSNFGILFDAQTDTAIIRNNLVYDVHTTGTAAMRGISIRSTSATGLNNVTEIYNNFISLHMPGGSSTSVIGLEYAGANLVNAKVWFNTISIGGTLGSSGTSGNVVSAAFSKTASNVGSSFELKNNLFLNSRTGGNAGTQHLAVSLANSVGVFTLDYNTYNSAGLIARMDVNTYATLADFALALGGQNEANGNNFAVQTINNIDLSLTGTALGNPALAGTPIANVSFDRFGNFRSNAPYRGAHEASPSLGGTLCSGTPDPGTLIQSDTLYCPGNAPILLVLTQASTIAGVVYEWQESDDNINFSVIAGATNDSLTVTPTATKWYRAVSRCLAAGTFAYSDTVYITNGVRPTVGALSFNIQGGDTYTFTLSNSVSVDSFIWNFGDGSADVITLVPTAVHTYTGGGSFPVRVKASNNCGIDSIQLNLNVTVSVPSISFPNLKIYPNPVTDQVYIQGISSTYQISLKDLQGRVIVAQEASSDFELPMQGLKPAVYLLEISDNSGKRSVHRLLKQ